MIKTNLNYRLFFLFKFLLLFVFCFKLFADDVKKYEKMVVIGSNAAPIKIKIFSSFTCPHCADFHTKIIPKIKEKYVNTNQVQIIHVDFPLDQAAFNASKLLHCIEQKNQISFLDKIYEDQDKWASGSNIKQINENLKKIVLNFGINEIKFDKCLNNEKISDRILNSRIDAHKRYSINSTPTIVINEKKLEGSVNFKNISIKIEKLI